MDKRQGKSVTGKVIPELLEKDPKIGRVVRSLIDGTVSDGGSGDFRELYFSLMDGAHWHRADNYHLIGDLNSYVEAKLKLNKDYTDKFAFAKKCWMNILLPHTKKMPRSWAN